jgi:TolB-like protein/DNA-binding winged helix-turn-helix (wHTH) protein/Tfp pilus assembly protein PilF
LHLCRIRGIISAVRVGHHGGSTAPEFHFADFTLDQARYQLQRDTRTLRLEKLPMELLILLVQRRGELVSREEIAEHLWGKSVFLDVDHSINTAVRKIRRVLRDDPEKPCFIETVVGKGYRFAAPVTCTDREATAQAQPASPGVEELSPSAVAAARPRVGSRGMRVLLGGVTILTVLILVLVLKHGRTANATSNPAIKSLAVLPLKNLSGDPSQEYFADGMTEAVIGRLSMIGGLRVISRTSAMQFKKTNMSTPEIARALHVDGFVEGSVIREGNRVRVSARLIRGATDEQLWSESYDRELQDALMLESEVAQSIASRVEVTLTRAERARLASARYVAPEVYESYLKGEFARNDNEREIEQRIAYFDEAVKKDATFAPAYKGLASSYDALGTVFVGAPPTEMREKVMAEARKALDLDPGLAEGHTLLANVYQKQWRWNDAESEYKLALELNPNDAEANLGFADWLLCQGRIEQALSWSRHARELDPFGVTGTSNGWILFHAHRYDEATEELRSVLAVHPDDATASWFLSFVLIANRKPEQAIPLLEKVLTITNRSPGVMGILIRAYAHAGRRAEALRLLGELKRRQHTGYVPAGAFVNAYLGLDDYDQAFAWLDRAYQEQSNILQFVKVHPYFDPLRSDPRFADLVRRVGLE